MIIAGSVLILIGLAYMIISMVKGFTEVMKTERMKPEGQNKESMWAIAIIVSYFFMGMGIILPLIHTVMNKNFEGFKKLIVTVVITLITIPLGIFLLFTSLLAQ